MWAIAGVLFLFSYLRRSPAAQSQGPGLRFVVWNNWLMVLLAIVILVGTLFPFFSGLLSKHPISLKSEYFTKITAPGGLALLLLLGACPHLIHHGFGKSWRTVGAVVTALAAILIWVLGHRLAVAYFVACAFVTLNLAADFVVRYRRARGPAAPAGKYGYASVAMAPGLRWYGARIVHIGVLLTFVGIAGSGGFDTEKRVALKPGERVQVGGFDLAYDDLNTNHGPNFTAVKAKVSVYQGQQRITQLAPALAFYGASGKRTSEVDIRRTLAGDLYLALTEADRGTKLINLTIFTKPLINWIWIGNVLMVMGTLLVLAAAVTRRRSTPQGDTTAE
jgi:cytochrome c-type biogenesis protein CcmF